MVILGLVALFVGFICGCTSVGGVLLIPAMDAWSDIGLRKVMGTALFSFFFAGLVGLYMHYKAGRIDPRTVAPLCVSSLLFGYGGAVAKEYVSVPALTAILAVAIIFAGITALRPMRATGAGTGKSQPRRDTELFILGAGVSFVSAMTGAGGPVLSVPLMIILGYPSLMSIAAALPLQVALTFSGSIGNIVVGSIDYPLGAMVTVLMIVGVAAGTYSIRFFKPDLLKIIVSCLCIVTGTYMLARTFL